MFVYVSSTAPISSFAQVEQKQLEKRTFLSVPGYDSKERFEFGVITSFAYPIENSGLIDFHLQSNPMLI
jgi:hypothetical protein